MTKTKRLLSFMLALIMIASILPMSVVAASTEYTGVEVRMQSVSPSDTIKDANLLLKAASDPNAATFEPNPAIDMQYEWYYRHYNEWDIPESERADYTLFTYNDMIESTAFIKKVVDTSEYFKAGQKYLCLVTLTTKNGYTFTEDCAMYPGNMTPQEQTSNKIVLALNVFPDESTYLINNLPFTCTNDGVVHVSKAPDEYMYIAKATDGRYDELAYNNPVGQPAGSASVNNNEYVEIFNPINVKNAPQIQLLLVKQYDWENHATSVVYGYGTYTIPMSSPYINVDTLEFGEAIEVLDVGTSAIGQYGENIASATFDGWFVDANATVPATLAGELYAVFTLRSNSMFEKDITAADFSLRCNGTAYSGSNLIETNEETTKKIAFLIPSERVTVTVTCTSEGGRASINKKGITSVELTTGLTGKYPTIACMIDINEGYYIQSIIVNGEDWTNNPQSPIYQSDYRQIFNYIPYGEGYEEGFFFQPEGNTLIEIKLAKADIITINCDGLLIATEGLYANEYYWHSSRIYYVAEGYGTTLFDSGAIRKDKPVRQSVIGLNTKPDGTGYGAVLRDDGFFSWVGGDFAWNPGNPYENGVSDEITLYPIMFCRAHVVYGMVDDAWEYHDAQPATCDNPGNVAYRYCPNCHMYQVKNDAGKYVNSTIAEVTVPQASHNHTKYSDNGNGTHSVQCENCTDIKIEDHTYENDVCVCGAKKYIKGDVNNDGIVDDADVEYLLYYTIFPEEWPINQPIDFNGDGAEDDADAEYLLYYTIFPEDNPLN